jgi:hypothetical protein
MFPPNGAQQQEKSDHDIAVRSDVWLIYSCNGFDIFANFIIIYLSIPTTHIMMEKKEKADEDGAERECPLLFFL